MLLLFCNTLSVLTDHLPHLFPKVRDELSSAFLDIAHHVVLLLCQVSNVLTDTPLVISSELKIRTEHLSLVDEIIVAHNFLQLDDHRSHNASVSVS